MLVGRTTLVGAGEWFDGVIAVFEDGRAMTERDVTDLLAVPVVASVPVDPAIARATDAGILLARLRRLPLRRPRPPL